MGVLPLMSASVWRGPTGLIPFGALSGSLPPSPVCPLCPGQRLEEVDGGGSGRVDHEEGQGHHLNAQRGRGTSVCARAVVREGSWACTRGWEGGDEQFTPCSGRTRAVGARGGSSLMMIEEGQPL